MFIDGKFPGELYIKWDILISLGSLKNEIINHAVLPLIGKYKILNRYFR